MKQKLILLLLLCVPAWGLLSFSRLDSAGQKQASLAKHTRKLPFKAEYETSRVTLSPPPFLREQISGVGNATHLGNSEFEAISNVNLSTPPPFQIHGEAVFHAANGDEFYTTFTGSSTPNGDGTVTVTIYHTITGGTGRFEDASGSLIGHPKNTPGTLTGHLSVEGFINY